MCFQSTYDKVYDAELPTSQFPRAVPPRGQYIFCIYRSTQLGASHKRLWQGSLRDTHNICPWCDGVERLFRGSPEICQ